MIEIKERIFLRIPEACRATGLSQNFLRKGCRDGSVPHVQIGRAYLINVPALLEKLDHESREGMPDA